MRKIKIGVLIDQLVPGGVQKSAIQEAIHLKKLGYEVTVFVLVRLTYQYQYEDLSRGLKLVFLSDYNPRFFRQAIPIPRFSFLTNLHLINPFFVKRYKVLSNIDFIISHGTTTCITAAAISRKLKIPYMAFIWDPMAYILEKVYGSTKLHLLFPILKPIIGYYESNFLTSAALIATSSEVHKQFIEENYHVNPLIIHPGCFPPKTIPKKNAQFILGYTRWELSKKPDFFLWLAKKMPKARFLLAGSWTRATEEEQFKKEIKRLHLEDRVFLKSPITKADLKKIAADSIAWLHPNFEAFGMAGLEMAALGLPIIVPKGSGITELFEEGKHGFFPKAEDKHGYFKAIKFFVENPEKATEMGKAASQIARHSTWRQHTKKAIKIIETYHSQTKVVCLANAFVSTKSTGGGDQFLIELARRAPNNVYLTVILPSPGFYHWQRAGVTNKNIRYIVLESNNFDNQDLPIQLFLAYFIRCVQTYFLLPKLPPFDVLHTSTDLIPDAIPAYFYRRKNADVLWATRFFHFIESPIKRKGRLWVNIGSYLLQKISLKLLPKADIVMIDNSELKEGLVKNGLETIRIRLHPGGVNTKGIIAIKPSKIYSSSAVFIGRLQPHKGVFDALDIWKKVVKIKPKAKLIMIGHGPEEIKEKLEAQIKRARLGKNIVLTGYIYDRDKIARYTRSSKLLLFLDHEAGFGLVIAEAMTAGLPVVAYDLPIFGSVYKKGFLISPLSDTQKAAEHVTNLLDDGEGYKNLAKDARKEAQRFDWELISRRFYEDIIRLAERRI